MSQVLDSGCRVNANGGFSAPPFSAAATGGGGACMSTVVIITVRLPCTLQLSIRVWVGLVMLAKGRCVRVTTDRGRRVVKLARLTLPHVTPRHVDLSATNCLGQTAEDSALLGVVVISRPQRLVGPRSVRCGRFACVVALPTVKPIQTPRAPATTAFLWLESTWSPSP